MLTQIKKIGKINGVTVTNPKEYNLSEMIQESYTTYYKAKKVCDSKVVKLAESHIANVKKNPTNLKSLSEDLDTLKGIVKLGKDVKDCEEVTNKPARRKRMRPIEECDDTVISKASKKADESKKRSKKESKSWSKINSSNLKEFKENAKSKVFYKELGRFNKDIADKKPLTLSESMNLYKASNSCLTHLTIELNRNPKFSKTFNECTDLLATDNMKLLKAIREGKTPDVDLLENFVRFTNVLLESETELDKECYDDLEEEDLLDKEDDIDLLEECDPEDNEELEESEEEETDELLPPDDLPEDEPVEDELEESDEGTIIDITEDELKVLKSILSKILPSVNEDVDTVPDEEEVSDDSDEETDPIDSEIPEDEPVEDELEESDEDDLPPSDSDELPPDEDEDLEEEDELLDPDVPPDEDEELDEDILDREDDEDLLEDKEVDDEDLEDKTSDLTESAKLRIKKCF